MGGNSGRSRVGIAWPVMRALYEGSPVTAEALADISGRQVKTITDAIEREGWDAPRIPSAIELGQRISRLTASLIREMEEIEKAAVDGLYDKARVEAVTGMLRVLERLAEINDSREVRQEEEQKTDAEIADILRRIDARIVELAHEFAREIAGGGEAAPLRPGN
jgi:hypothetical protein